MKEAFQFEWPTPKKEKTLTLHNHTGLGAWTVDMTSFPIINNFTEGPVDKKTFTTLKLNEKNNEKILNGKANGTDTSAALKVTDRTLETPKTVMPETKNNNQREPKKIIPDFQTSKPVELIVFRNITELGIQNLDIDTSANKESRNFQREIRIRNEGEVLRAFQGALGAKPSKKEWDMLFDRIDAKRTWEKKLTNNTNLSKTETHKKVLEEGDRGIKFLLSDIAHLNTPLGKKLRGSSHQFLKEQTPEALREHIKEGKKVIITTEVAGKGRHMIHVGIAKAGEDEGKLIALSEQGKPVLEIMEGSKFTTMIFKISPEAEKKAARKRHLLNLLKKVTSKEAKNYRDYSISL